MTFDDTAGQNQTGVYQAGEAFTDQGLTFTYSASGSAYAYLYDSSFGPAAGTNGTNALLVGATGTDYVTISLAGGGLFSLSSLTLGIDEPSNGQTTDSVTINGVTRSVSSSATTYAVNLTNVSSVRLSALAGGGYVALDNISYQVPEPGALLILAAGLAGVTFARRSSAKG